MLFNIGTFARELNDVQPGLVPLVHRQVHAGALPDQGTHEHHAQCDDAVDNRRVFHLMVNLEYVINVEDAEEKPDRVVHHPVVPQNKLVRLRVEADDQNADHNEQQCAWAVSLLGPGDFQGAGEQVVFLDAVTDHQY